MKNKAYETFPDPHKAGLVGKEVVHHITLDGNITSPFCRTIKDADGHAVLTGICGDTMEIFVKIENDRVSDASYRTDGCSSSSICGSYAAELSIGKRADEILDMSGKTILQETGRFPEDEEHCAHLAIATLKEAINLFMKKSVKQT